MAISRKKNDKKVEEQKAAAAAPRKTAKASQAELKAKEAHEKALQAFHPDVVTFFKDKLGIELKDQKTALLYDILQGKLTEPVSLVVSPVAYDKEQKKEVEMPRIKTVASIRVILPMENGKAVAPDNDKHKIYVATVPCRPMIEKAEAPEATVRTQPEVERELPTFTESQLLALEGVGIDRSRKFETTYPEGRDAAKVIDLLEARRVGALELDFFRRDNQGSIITNVNRAPILNEAGANLVNYGMAMEPVKGYIHKREFDSKSKKFVDKVETGWYQVIAVNGNLFATRMKETKVKGIDGEEIVRPEIVQARVRDGKVFINGKTNEPLEFATERDLTDFMAGRGGVVKNAVHHDFKSKKDVVYDAFVVPDNTKAGFARQFTPDTSKKLIERRDRKVSAVKKQNFGFGI